MVKSYLRYEPLKTFGIISSWLSNIIYDATGKLAISPALEDVVIWDLKKGIKIGCWHDADNKSEVTVIQKSPNKVDYAVGYSDGSIRIWNIKSSILPVIFNGHRGAVTALAFDKNGTRLASGSKDTDLIVWDIVGEVGLYRMRGHKDQITAIRFLQKPLVGIENSDDVPSSSPGFILSSSKDTLLKLWDLNTQHCVETVVAHRNEIWDFDVSRDETMLVTGSGDPELKVWKINHQVLANGILESDEQQNEDDNNENQKAIVFYGNVSRQSKERVTTLKFHPNTNFLGVQGSDKFIEIFRLRTHEEIKKKQHRRRKREQGKKLKELNKKKEEGNSEIVTPLESDVRDEIHASDEITLHEIIRTTAKVRSFDFAFMEDIAKTEVIQLLTSLKNNMLEVYNCYLPSKKEEKHPHTKLFSIDIHGHRSEIRTLALSSNDELLCSASMVRRLASALWNAAMHYVAHLFLEINMWVVIGTKTGELELFDIASSSLIKSINAHDSAIWSLQVQPNQQGLVTGSADKQVKFWNFEIKEKRKSDEISTRHLTLVHNRTLKITDDVLCVRISPNSKLIAASLLDATVKVFYQDSLKFFLSLYGHKLPVLSMDISSDNTLLITCSADKNVKIWGLDFGDCHRSIFAHQDSIMFVQFVANTHYFFTAGKDKLVKYWDGDKFENITKLEGHHGEVWALAISKNGEFLVSASHDRSIRIWEQTDEPLFLEEEREKEMEELYESTLTTSMEKTSLEDTVELTSAGKQTMETLKAGEKIMEALEIADEDKSAIDNYKQMKAKGHAHIAAPPKRNPILLALGNLTAEQYVLRTIEKVRSAELEESLLVLPFAKVISLLEYLDIWAKKEWNIALVCRILFHLLRVHHDQIVANRIMRPMLDSIRTHLRAALKRQKDTLGYNLAAMKYIKRDWEANATAEFFMDDNNVEGLENVNASSAKKRKFINLTTD
ncbi:2687_t:CDS:10 [Ambispora gerdemannii]|uniref:2687_t:CDS:1 n=1 Tax=Ambispora gerdemannii TaxID=144530 RepID=A0A9N8V9E7_9GLOM|nr:2687_t:CDS:10 [Ambispora gerdemannii]